MVLKKYLAILAIFMLVSAVTWAEATDDKNYSITEESLEDVVDEAADLTGTKEVDRKTEYFDELSGKNRKLTDEQIKGEVGDDDKKTLAEVEAAKKGASTKIGGSSDKTKTVESVDKKNTVFLGEVEDISQSENVHHLKKVKLDDRMKVSSIRVKNKLKKKIDKIELFTFNIPVKIHRLYVITDRGFFYTKKNITVGKDYPYVLNLGQNKVKKMFVIYEAMKKTDAKSYLFILGIDE